MTTERLLTPGPTEIPQSIMNAMERPKLHHRSEEFKRELTAATAGMKWLLNWDSNPLMLACSGTGAMEAALLNTTIAGDEIISVNAGAFGARWKDIGTCLGLTVHEITLEWGESITPECMKQALARHPNARAVCLQHCETSTTVLHPLETILPIIKHNAPEALTIVDGISSCITTPLPGDSTLIDMYIAGSQKAFMLPPGLAMVALSANAWKRVSQTPKRSLYFDLELARTSLETGQTPWTPATTLIVGLNEALRIFKEEGLENVYKRHAHLSRIARTGLALLGLKILANDYPSPSVTGFYPPSGICAEQLRSLIRTKYGIRLAGGQGVFKKQILRLGHMGSITPSDIVVAVQAIASAIEELGGGPFDSALEELQEGIN